MNRRGFLKAAASLPAAPILRVLPAISASAPATVGVLTAAEFLRRQRDFWHEWTVKIIDMDAALRDTLPKIGFPEKWLKPKED